MSSVLPERHNPSMHVVHPHIDAAFGSDQNLKKRIYSALGETPSHLKLFHEIATFITNLRNESARSAAGEPPRKKARTENETSQNGTIDEAERAGAILRLEDVSFSIPQRKKLSLLVGRNTIGGINTTSQSTEFGTAWDDVIQVICVPVPEKAQPARNFIVVPRNGDGVAMIPPGEKAPEPALFTFEEKRTVTVGEEQIPAADHLIQVLQKHKRIEVVRPEEAEFVSELVQPHRKGEKAYHVKAFKGSKEGYLFFLSTGILFGFKKPVLFFSFDAIESISFTSVLQRTFNLSITTSTCTPSGTNRAPQEFEFSMLDQADFAGIDAYIQRHELQNATMAEKRRAKKLNINPTKGGEEADGEGELIKAQREAEMQQDDDDDDDEDENFDPGSEGQSEGSGTSDEEDEEDGGGESAGEGEDENMDG